jgi:hypothetical protein
VNPINPLLEELKEEKPKADLRRPIRLKRSGMGKEPKPSLGVRKEWVTKPKHKSTTATWIQQFLPSCKQIWNDELKEGIMVFPHPYDASGKDIPAFGIVRYCIQDGKIEWKPRFVMAKKKSFPVYDLIHVEESMLDWMIKLLMEMSGVPMPTKEESKAAFEKVQADKDEEDIRLKIKKFRL